MCQEAGYEVRDGKVIAYKSVRSNLSSVYQSGFVYKIGKESRAPNCDTFPENENSFGLSIWTKKGAKEYYDNGKILEVEIPAKDIGVVVHEGKKIRCFGFTVVGMYREWNIAKHFRKHWKKYAVMLLGLLCYIRWMIVY